MRAIALQLLHGFCQSYSGPQVYQEMHMVRRAPCRHEWDSLGLCYPGEIAPKHVRFVDQVHPLFSAKNAVYKHRRVGVGHGRTVIKVTLEYGDEEHTSVCVVPTALRLPLRRLPSRERLG
jgi:hypothetical protein